MGREPTAHWRSSGRGRHGQGRPLRPARDAQPAPRTPRRRGRLRTEIHRRPPSQVSPGQKPHLQQSPPLGRRRTAPGRTFGGRAARGSARAVAAACAAMARAAGLQSVVMAPTEILARQHLHKFRAYLEESFPGLTVELLVSGQSAAERRRVRAAAASGHCALVVGTHALIEEEVEFADLGLAVVDEQHRFGTRQRELLRGKGRGRPHFLAMTATPIPRTLALAQFGEMSLSVIDELPPGRTAVETEVVPPDERSRAYDLVRTQVRLGRQAFVICPLIEESEKVIARSATAEFERLRRDVFPDLRLDLIHGRLKDKDGVMKRFVDGEIQVLVATAVVEVGVDVPNASVMMVEGADRFGLAQLHQFRGRVGRGAAVSYCLLPPNLIRPDTRNPPGEEHIAVELIERLLHDAHVECARYESEPGRPNLVARVKGRGKAPPMLLQGHVDVVTTVNQKWRHEPFGGDIVDGYLWGRGALDMKGGVAMMVGALLRAQAHGGAPGDLVLAVLADDEAGGVAGARWLVESHPQLFAGIRHAIGESGS